LFTIFIVFAALTDATDLSKLGITDQISGTIEIKAARATFACAGAIAFSTRQTFRTGIGQIAGRQDAFRHTKPKAADEIGITIARITASLSSGIDADALFTKKPRQTLVGSVTRLAHF
jgi:hypothetical protein